MKCIKYRAYSSSANLGPGFDILAVAHTAFYDEVLLCVEEGFGVVVESIEGPYAKYVDKENNTVVEALSCMMRDLKLDIGVRVSLWKGIPVGAGLGSSGASAAAAVKALNDLLKLNLPLNKLIYYAGLGERASAGEPHYDNVAASIVGGFVAIIDKTSLNVISWYMDADIVLAIPHVKYTPGKTAIMRSVIPRKIDLDKCLANKINIIKILLGLERRDLRLIGSGMNDHIVEPARAPYIPCYDKAREYAKKAGALGVALSGAGPAMIALCDGRECVENVSKAFKQAYTECGYEVDIIVAKVARGAYRVEQS